MGSDASNRGRRGRTAAPSRLSLALAGPPRGRCTSQRGALERAGKIAIDYETRLCAGINREEREQLIDLLKKLQVSQTDLRGVHPGLGKDTWRNS